MRHNKKFNHLGRTSSHRKAMLSNMASSLIMHKRIKTTVAKAKALRMYVEPLITKSKEDTTHSRRIVFSQLQNKEAVSELFREISQKIADRPGGYTRILKLGNRFGDAAEMCYIELVDYNENMLTDAGSKADDGKKRTRRSRRSKTEDAVVAEPTAAASAKTAKAVEVEEKAPEATATPDVPENSSEEADSTETEKTEE